MVLNKVRTMYTSKENSAALVTAPAITSSQITVVGECKKHAQNMEDTLHEAVAESNNLSSNSKFSRVPWPQNFAHRLVFRSLFHRFPNN